MRSNPAQQPNELLEVSTTNEMPQIKYLVKDLDSDFPISVHPSFSSPVSSSGSAFCLERGVRRTIYSKIHGHRDIGTASRWRGSEQK